MPDPPRIWQFLETTGLIKRTFFIGLTTLLFACPTFAEQKFITDEFEVTMRSGTSTANSILRMLRSGESVTVLEEDLASSYSLVETEDDLKGYVLTRFLVDRSTARQSLLKLQENFAQQQASLAQQKSEIESLNQSLAQARVDNENLKHTLRASERELAEIRETATNTLSIQEQNRQLQTAVTQLQQEQNRLTKENEKLHDSTQLDWLVRGGAVCLTAFLIGILVTRIRWRKQDSWGA